MAGFKLKGMWCVQAGIVIGERLTEYDRVFNYTGEDYEADNDRVAKGGTADKYVEVRQEALVYAADLMDPGRLNWVSVRWIWV